MKNPSQAAAELLREAQAAFNGREKDASEHVVRRRYGRAPRASLLPLHDERAHRHARAGRMLATAAGPADGIVEYGFDREDRLRVVRSHADRGQKGMLDEVVLVEHGPDEVRWAVHHESKGRTALEVGRLRLRAGAPLEAFVASSHECITERYHVDAHGRVMAIDRRTETRAARRKPATITEARFTVERDTIGDVLRVYVESGGLRATTYCRPRAGGREATAQALIDAIVSATLRLGAGARHSEPAFALAVSWSPGCLLPPLVSLGLISDRDRLGDDPWAPTEWRTSLDVDEDPEVVAACAELDAACPSPDDEPFIVEVLRRTAASLRQIDLSRVFPVTSDFVVLAVDWQLDELERGLREARM